jgi:anti-sigma factor RsiW
MQDCTQFEIQLTAFAAGELPAAEVVAVADHLAFCASCRAELRREQKLRLVLQDLPMVACPDRVTRAVQRQVAVPEPKRRTAGPARRPGLRRWPAGLGLVAAALVVALLGTGLRQRTSVPLPGEAATVVPARIYTPAEITQARREAAAVLRLTANVLDRSRDRTVVDVFGSRLPRAIGDALLPAAHQSPTTDQQPHATIPGGNG